MASEVFMADENTGMVSEADGGVNTLGQGLPAKVGETSLQDWLVCGDLSDVSNCV